MKKIIKDQAFILDHREIADQVFKMTLKTELTEYAKAGQFINIKIRDHSLRRPLSLSSINKENDTLVIIYKVIGQGTRDLSQYNEGENLDILGPLGSFFPVLKDKEQILLIGGGLGLPPLYQLAKEYARLGKEVTAILGFRSKKDVFLKKDFEDLGVRTLVATDDGSLGFKGTALDLARTLDQNPFVYAVGPKALLRGIQEEYKEGYLSLEERMACGVGLCMACVCKDKTNPDKNYRICKEGPVFNLGRVEI